MSILFDQKIEFQKKRHKQQLFQNKQNYHIFQFEMSIICRKMAVNMKDSAVLGK